MPNTGNKKLTKLEINNDGVISICDLSGFISPTPIDISNTCDITIEAATTLHASMLTPDAINCPPAIQVELEVVCTGNSVSPEAGITYINTGDPFSFSFTTPLGYAVTSVLINGVESINLINFTVPGRNGSYTIPAVNVVTTISICTQAAYVVTVNKLSPDSSKNSVTVGVDDVATTEYFVVISGGGFSVNFGIETSITSENDLYRFVGLFENGSPVSPSSSTTSCIALITGTYNILSVTADTIIDVQFEPIPKQYDIDFSNPSCYVIDNTLGIDTVSSITDLVYGYTANQPIKSSQPKIDIINGCLVFTADEFISETNFFTNPFQVNNTTFIKYQPIVKGNYGAPSNIEHFTVQTQGLYPSPGGFRYFSIYQAIFETELRLSSYNIYSGLCGRAVDTVQVSALPWYFDMQVSASDVFNSNILTSSGKVANNAGLCCTGSSGTDLFIKGGQNALFATFSETRLYRVVAWDYMAQFQKDAIQALIY